MSEFGALDFQTLLDAMRDAMKRMDEQAYVALLSNYGNVLLAALEIAADQSPF